jgi:hypothetical protein
VENQVHYLLVSHGPTGSAHSLLMERCAQACPGAGTTADADNCINDNNSRRRVCMASDTADADFYDDMVEYKKDVPSKYGKNPVTPVKTS